MEEKAIKKLLEKFSAGKCSAEELELLRALMQELDTDEIAEPVSGNLKQAIWDKIENQTREKGKIKRINTRWLQVAAVLLIMLFASIFFHGVYTNREQNKSIVYQIITASKGQMKQVVLPDSSVVYLNAASTLKIPVEFSSKRRDIFLIGGEAFFDVKHDASRPFLVHAGKVTTQVLGTSFNIKFYKELSYLQVFVNSGKVEVHNQAHTLGMYTPGQQLTYNKQNESFVKRTIPGDYMLSWMHDELILDNVSFEELVVYIQNRYSVKFEYAHKKPGQRYSVRLSNKLSINQVINILQLIDGRKYRLRENVVTIK